MSNLPYITNKYPLARKGTSSSGKVLRYIRHAYGYVSAIPRLEAGDLRYMKVKDIFPQFIEYLKSENKAQRTVEERERFLYGAIGKSIGDYQLSDLKLSDFTLVREKGREQGASGANGAIVTLRRFLKYCSDCDMRFNFYWRDIDIPRMIQKEVEALTLEEIDQIRKSIARRSYATRRDKDDHAQIRFRAIFETILHTGLRIGEILSLDKKDFDYKQETLVAKNIKTKEVNVISCVGATRYIKEYLEYRDDDCPALFISSTTNPARLNRQTAKGYLRTFRKRLGMKKHLCYHIIRKTYCTFLLSNGADIKTTQYLARHKSERTTLRYYIAVNKTKAMNINNSIMSGI